MDCTVVELRQYTLHSGERDALIELFERELVHTQEAVGIGCSASSATSMIRTGSSGWGASRTWSRAAGPLRPSTASGVGRASGRGERHDDRLG